MALTVVRTRGSVTESSHAVTVAVVDSDGTLIASSGDPRRITLARSAAKPFQAVPLVEDGVVERFQLTDVELALTCASHSSERRQVERVAALLSRVGLEPRHLACGSHRPLGKDFAVPPIGEADPAEVQLVPPSPISSNCSGKHTGMLALATMHGWPVAGYESRGHPVQDRARGVMARFAGVPGHDLIEAVDGCGVVAFGLPLDRLAFAFAAFGTSEDAASQRVARAMTNEPAYVAGCRRLCTELMQASPGRVLAKVGAEGVYGASLPERGLGVALKVEDGSAKAAMIAVMACLRALEIDGIDAPSLDRFAQMPLSNTRGEDVGEMRASGRLTFV